MARRFTLNHDQHTRDKIKTSQLINRLQSFAFGEKDITSKKVIEMTAIQANVALGLLKKTLPDLTAVEMSGEVVTRTVSADPLTADEWAAQYGQGPVMNGNGKAH